MTRTVQAPAEVAPIAACGAVTMQTGHISYSSNPRARQPPEPTRSDWAGEQNI